MSNALIKPSTLLILLSLTWIPETLVLLQLIYGKAAGHSSVMKPLMACFELAFIAAIVLERKPLILPASINRLRLPLGLWLGWTLLATLFSDHPSIASFRSIEWLTHVLFSIALISYLYRNTGTSQEIAGTLVAGFIIYTFLYILYVYQYGDSVLGFDNIRHYGHYAVVALLMSLSIRRKEILSLSSLLKILALTTAWTVLFWTGGRGPLLSVTIIAITFTFCGLFAKRSHLLVILLVSAIAGFLLSIPLSGQDHGIYSILHSISESQDVDSLSSNRLSIWFTTLSDILAHPVFGLGPEGFIYGAGTQFHPILHPHNSLLQFASEWGLPGAIFFVWLLYRIYSPAIRSTTTDHNGYFFAALLTGSTILFYSLVTGNLYIPFSTFLFVIVTSIILADSDPSNETLIIDKRAPIAVLFIAIMVTLSQGYITKEFLKLDAQLPNERQTRLLMAAPVFMTHPTSQARVIEWSHDYYRDGDIGKAMEWLDWGKNNLPREWMFLYSKAGIFLDLGMNNKAKQSIAAMRSIPEIYQEQVDCLQDRIRQE